MFWQRDLYFIIYPNDTGNLKTISQNKLNLNIWNNDLADNLILRSLGSKSNSSIIGAKIKELKTEKERIKQDKD